MIIGESYPTSGVTIIYLMIEFDLTDENQVKFETGFNVDEDLIMKIWCKSLTEKWVFNFVWQKFWKNGWF